MASFRGLHAHFVGPTFQHDREQQQFSCCDTILILSSLPLCLGPPVHELPARGQGAVREQRGGEVPHQTAPPAATPARQRGNLIKSNTPYISKRFRDVYSVKKTIYVKIKLRKLQLFTSLDKVFIFIFHI